MRGSHVPCTVAERGAYSLNLMVDIAGPEHDDRMSEIEKLPSRSAHGTDRVRYEHAVATHAPEAETTLGPLACMHTRPSVGVALPAPASH
jgi:hypothetical protein